MDAPSIFQFRTCSAKPCTCTYPTHRVTCYACCLDCPTTRAHYDCLPAHRDAAIYPFARRGWRFVPAPSLVVAPLPGYNFPQHPGCLRTLRTFTFGWNCGLRPRYYLAWLAPEHVTHTPHVQRVYACVAFTVVRGCVRYSTRATCYSGAPVIPLWILRFTPVCPPRLPLLTWTLRFDCLPLYLCLHAVWIALVLGLDALYPMQATVHTRPHLCCGLPHYVLRLYLCLIHTRITFVLPRWPFYLYVI